MLICLLRCSEKIEANPFLLGDPRSEVDEIGGGDAFGQFGFTHQTGRAHQWFSVGMQDIGFEKQGEDFDIKGTHGDHLTIGRGRIERQLVDATCGDRVVDHMARSPFAILNRDRKAANRRHCLRGHVSRCPLF